MATRKCRTCQAKLRVDDTHALCWEHIGRSHFCDKCEDLVPFGVYKDYQQFLADCWREKDEKEGVDSMPHLSPCRRRDTAEEGEIVEAVRGASHSASRAVQDGGAHEEEAVAIAEEREEAINGDFGSKSPQASDSLSTIEAPPKDISFVWRKVKGLEASVNGIRAEVKSGLMSFKEEMRKFFSGKFSPSQEAEDEGSSIVSPTQAGVEYSEEVEDDSVEEVDDSLVEFKRRLSRIEGTQSKPSTSRQEPPRPSATATVSQVTNQPLVIHVFQDKEKEEKGRKEDDVDERDNDEDSLALGDLVKSHLGKDDYKSYMSDQVCRDLTMVGPELTNTALQWARVCLDQSIPSKTHFHEAMWAHVIMADESVYKTTMVPKMVNQADSAGVKSEIRQPRIPVSEKECGAWRKQVNEVLTSSSSTQNLSLITQSIKNNYQFIDKDFKRVGMDPGVDVYVKEVCSMMGRKEPKFDKQSMAYKTLVSTNTMFRIITFMRVAIESGSKLYGVDASDDKMAEGESILPMYFKVLDKASEDLRLVTARLHGLSLRKVRGQVLEGSPFEKSDRDKLVRATCLPSQFLFAGRLPDGEGFRNKDAQTARAKEEVERLEKRKRFAVNKPQGPPPKRQRFDQPRGRFNQSGYGRQGGNTGRQYQDNKDRREPFRPSWKRGDQGGKPAGRGRGTSFNARK